MHLLRVLGLVCLQNFEYLPDITSPFQFDININYQDNKMLKLFSLVFVGGGIGSVARFGIARLISLFAIPVIPLATFSVNIIGSLLIGLFWGIPSISEKNSWIHLLAIGFCGGFTTFSSFSWENLNLLKQGNIFLFFVYVLSSVFLCLLATWGGYSIGKSLWFG